MEFEQKLIILGLLFLSCSSIKFALNKKIPLFHKYFLSFINFSAVAKSGFSTNSDIFSPLILI